MGRNDYIYFVSSTGRRVFLSSEGSHNYWECAGRTGFAGVDIETFTEKMASGTVKLLGKAPMPRTCTMQMVCVGADSAERDRVFYDMMDALTDADGSGQGKLYVRKADGAMAYLNCVYVSGANAAENYKTVKKFKLQFYATDPYFYLERRYTYHDIIRMNGILTVNNPSNTPMDISMVFENKSHAIEQFTGEISNATTSKKITFQNTVIPFLTKFIMNIKHDKFEVLEMQDENRSSGNRYIDWTNTNRDFAIAPGINVLSFLQLSLGQSVSDNTTISILNKIVGV